jgi:hypothetical protein
MVDVIGITARKSYIHHLEHQVTAAIGQLAAGIEAENRRAEAEQLARIKRRKRSTGKGFGGHFLNHPLININPSCQRR